MQTSIAFLTLAALSHISAAFPSPLGARALVQVERAAAPIGTNALTNVYLCKDTNFVGCSNFETQTGVCYNVNSEYNDVISGAQPARGTTCVLYQNGNCAGSSITINNPGIPDLRALNFNDITSSYRCS